MQLLVTKELNQLRPILRGGDIRLAYRQLLLLLGNTDIARQLFAEPLPLNSNKIAWYCHFEGHYQTLDLLSKQERWLASQVVEQQIETLKQTIAQYEDEGVKDFLNKCLEIPDWKAIYVSTPTNIGNIYRVVLVEWGFLKDTVPYEKGIIEKWITNAESDDGLDDKLDSTTGSRTMDLLDKTLTYCFDVGKNEIKVSVELFENSYVFFKNQPKYYTYYNTRPQNWEQLYHQMFINSKEDKNALNNLLNALKQQHAQFASEPTYFIEYVTAFVQTGIAYDFEKLNDTERVKRYPYETLYLGKGVCEDKTILLAKLLILLDYKVVLLSFPKANHIAIGLQVPQGYGLYNYNGEAFCFLETTVCTPIGEMPEKFMDGTRIEETAKMIPIEPNGRQCFQEMSDYLQRCALFRQRYGQEYLYASADAKKLLEVMYVMRQDMEKAKATRHVDIYNNYVAQYNVLVEKFNADHRFN